MIAEPHIAFLGTSRSGLGHLRRIATIARCLSERAPKLRLSLVSNAQPAGLAAADLEAFSTVSVCDRPDMVNLLSHSNVDLAVLDTLRLNGIAAFKGLTTLILRETPDHCLDDFRRDDGRPWDGVILPNAEKHWAPAIGTDFAHKVSTTGWIVRPTGIRRPAEPTAGFVLATGGGGTSRTRAQLYPLLESVIAQARLLTRRSIHLRQALGPRADGEALSCADEIFDPGSELHSVFRAADLVISTAGYNSVLELATTDTPAMIASIPRSLDDQTQRVRQWGAKLGFGLTSGNIEQAALWLAHQVDQPRRRAPVDLGTDGAQRASDLLLEMLCTHS